MAVAAEDCEHFDPICVYVDPQNNGKQRAKAFSAFEIGDRQFAYGFSNFIIRQTYLLLGRFQHTLGCAQLGFALFQFGQLGRNGFADRAVGDGVDDVVDLPFQLFQLGCDGAAFRGGALFDFVAVFDGGLDDPLSGIRRAQQLLNSFGNLLLQRADADSFGGAGAFLPFVGTIIVAVRPALFALVAAGDDHRPAAFAAKDLSGQQIFVLGRIAAAFAPTCFHSSMHLLPQFL